MKEHVKRLVMAALMTSLTCLATMIIKISAPGFGYIHLGDGLVLLCGIALGPAAGAAAAGTGSMLADIFSGYLSWAPATFVIKACSAGIAGLLFYRLRERMKSAAVRNAVVVLSGLAGESFMVAGYFLYETGLAAAAGGGFTKAAVAAAASSCAIGILFNLVQGATGIVICLLLLPVLLKIPGIRDHVFCRGRKVSPSSLAQMRSSRDRVPRP